MAVLKKILFKNKRVGGTPVNAPNLNQVQDNTQEALNTLETDTNKRIENTNGKIEETKINAQNELDKVKSNLINLSAEGEEIQVNDSSDLSAKIDVRGNTKQNGEPTPDYPQEIESVKAYNLYDNSTRLSGKIVTSTGTIVESGSWDTSSLINVNNKNIQWHFINNEKNNFLLAEYKENGNFINRQQFNGYLGNTTIPITLNAETRKIRISWINSQQMDEHMVYEGTEQKPYQNYGEIAVKQTGKNIFDKKLLKDGVFTTIQSIFIKGKANTKYTFSSNIDNSYADSIGFSRIFIKSGHIEGQNEWSTKENGVWLGQSRTITTDNNGELTIGYRANNEKIPLKNFWYQLELGTSATKDELYKETIYPLHLGNIELNKIGEAQDYFHRINGKWHLHSNFDKYVFTGDENLDIESSGRFRTQKFQNIIRKTPTNIIANIKSNRFKAYTANDTWHNKTINGISVDSSGNINIRILNYIDLNQFKQWLKDNPTEIVYELETPTETEITDPVLINQLNALEKAEMFKPTTILTNNSIAIMKLDYIADTKTYIDNLIKPKEQIQQAIPQTIPENKELEK